MSNTIWSGFLIESKSPRLLETFRDAVVRVANSTAHPEEWMFGLEEGGDEQQVSTAYLRKAKCTWAWHSFELDKGVDQSNLTAFSRVAAACSKALKCRTWFTQGDDYSELVHAYGPDGKVRWKAERADDYAAYDADPDPNRPPPDFTKARAAPSAPLVRLEADSGAKLESLIELHLAPDQGRPKGRQGTEAQQAPIHFRQDADGPEGEGKWFAGKAPPRPPKPPSAPTPPPPEWTRRSAYQQWLSDRRFEGLMSGKLTRIAVYVEPARWQALVAPFENTHTSPDDAFTETWPTVKQALPRSTRASRHGQGGVEREIFTTPAIAKELRALVSSLGSDEEAAVLAVLEALLKTGTGP